jgi:hypothetical protein
MPRGIERISFGDMVLYEHQLDTANGPAKCQEAEDDSEDANCPVKGGISSFSLHCGKMKTKQINWRTLRAASPLVRFFVLLA